MTTPVYRDLATACSRIDARKTHYRFDLEADVRWGQLDQRGLHFGPAFLEALGIDLSALAPPAQELFQWAYALSLCEAFYALEDLIIRFERRERVHLGSTRSMELLCDEELKHIELFARYRDRLREQRPELARRFDELRRPAEALPGSPEDRDSYDDVASYHYGFWLNTLFFEEFTIFLHDRLHLDLAVVQPTWASVHRCHWQEEIQHVVTDVAHLEALALAAEQRHTLSKVFLFRLEEGFERFFGLTDAWALVDDAYPDLRELERPAFRELPFFQELLHGPAFKRTRQVAPYLAELAGRLAPSLQAARPATLARLAGPPLPPLRDATLADALRRTARESPAAGISYVQDDGSEERETYAELLGRAQTAAGALAAAGLAAGDRALLLLRHPRDFVAAFWACQLLGVVPAPLGLKGPSLAADERLARIADRLEQAVLVADDELLAGGEPTWSRTAVSASDLSGGAPGGEVASAAAETAFLQFSSGSTGDPRGVVLTHANVLSNVEAILQHRRVTPADVMLSWMPLHHDMGLCCHVAPLVHGMNQVLLTPFLFARRPNLWLKKLHEHRATITSSPNFGLSLCLRRLTPALLERLDLSALDCILNGAEPISAALAERFLAALAPAGLPPEAMCPAYGLAEATVAVTQGRRREGLRTRSFARDSLHDPAGAREVRAPDAVRLVDCGVPVPGCEIRVVGADGEPVGPGVVGELQIRGANVTRGYFGAEHSALFVDGWLVTGDLGLIQEGRLFVAGRAKDVLFVNGRNLFAADLEAVLQTVEGLTPDRLAVIGSTDPVEGDERVVAFVRHRPRSGVSREAVAATVAARLVDAAQFPVHGVCFLRSDEFPLTTSGKVQRGRLREAFEQGRFEVMRVTPDELLRTPAAASAAEVSPPAPLVEAVRAIWADVLNRPADQIPTDQGFLAIGGDSLRAVEVHGCIEDQWGLLLDQRILLECQTVNEQATFLERTLPSAAAEGDAGADETMAPSSTRPTPEIVVHEHDVAVVAMAGRFPAAPDLEAFWELLRAGRTAFVEPPPDRWDADRYYDPDPQTPGKTVCRTGAFLDGIKQFDAEACSISAEEGRQIDPQQRIFLELVYDLLDQAHLSTSKVGVFAGAASNEYFWRHASLTQRINRLSAQTNLGNLVAARIAQLLHFTGPAMTLDAACATSLVAVHLACRSLRGGECELAIAGGVQLNLTVIPHLMFSQAGVLSPRGRCQPYAREADGFVPGEGAGAVLLKPLAAALRDHDPILGVIRGSAVNNDGGALSGMAPNPAGQREVLSEAYADAGVDPRTVSYVEGHGAGTRVGDPVEIRSLSEVFAEAPHRSIGIGSVKSNVGHLFHAAGVAGLIKVLLALRHGELPPTAGCEEPAPRIRFDRTPFAPVQSLRPWSVPAGQPRRAGINSFGVGGTNCHIIIEEPPRLDPPPQAEAPRLLCLSAVDSAGLVRVGRTFADTLDRDPALDLATFCAHANQRALRFRCRRALVVGSREEVGPKLREEARGASTVRAPRLVFLFPGPGSQYPRMGHHLRREPAFREALAECDAVFRPLLGRPVGSLFEADSRTQERLDHAQPVVFAFSYALARWLEHLNVVPEAVLGHSAGEYVAACLAGVLSLQDAARLVYARGQAMAATPPGAMAAVLAGEERVRAVVDELGGVSIACLNQPDQVVISGDPSAVEQALTAFSGQGTQVRRLAIPRAAHSPLMIPAQEALAPHLEGVRAHAPQRTFFSSLVGSRVTQLAPDHWLDHLRAPVRFSSAVRAALAAGYRHFVEVGPSAALSYCVSSVADRYGPEAPDQASVYPLLRRSVPGWAPTLETLGRLFEGGAPLHTGRLDGAHRRRFVALPAYPYQRRELWLEPPPLDLPLPPRARAEPPESTRPGPLPLDLATCPSIRDHRVYGELTAPSGLLFDLVLGELARTHPGGSGLEEVLIGRPLSIVPGGARLARVREAEDSREGPRAVLESRRDEAGSPWEEHLSAKFVPLRRGDDWVRVCQGSVRRDLAAIRARCTEEVTPTEFHRHLAAGGMTYGPTLETIAEIRRGEREVLTRLEPRPRSANARAGHALHPAVLDGAIRSIGTLTLDFPAGDGAAFLGFAVRRLAVRKPVLGACLAHLELRPDCRLDPDVQALRFDATLLDDQGEVLAVLEEVCLKRRPRADPPIVDASGEVPLLPGGERFYAVEWEPSDRPTELREVSPEGSTVLVGAATPLRAALQREVEAADGVALVLTAPKEPDGSWEGLLARFTDPARAALLRFVVLEPSVSRLGALATALVRLRVRTLTDLLVVSSDPAVLGFLKALAREQPDWRCRGVEVDAGELSVPGLATWIHDELSAVPRDLAVAYREGQRWLPVLRRVEPDRQATPLRPGGVYWITGGLGVLGSAIAEALATRVGARLLLTGRRPHADPEVLARIEAGGGEALYVAADAADRAAMERAREAARARWGPLHGAIHTAGAVDDALVPARVPDRSRAVLRPKVVGGRVLAEVTAGEPLDFLVFFSSLVGLSGKPGQSDYAAGNAALDALARRLRVEGRPAQSLAWGPWKVGMAGHERYQQHYALMGLHPFARRAGVRAFLRALTCDAAHLVVVDLEARRESELVAGLNRVPTPTKRSGLGAPRSVGTTQTAGRSTDVGAGKPSGSLQTQVRTVVAKHLSCDPARVELHTHFEDLGIDSLLAVDIIKDLQEELNVRLYPTLLFEIQTLQELTQHLQAVRAEGGRS